MVRRGNFLAKVYRKLNVTYSQVNLLREFGASISFMLGVLNYCMVQLLHYSWLVNCKNLYSIHSCRTLLVCLKPGRSRLELFFF